MKTKLLNLSLLFFTFSILAQKKEVYLNESQIKNEDLIFISKKKYNINVKGFIYYNFQFDLDTLTLNVKVERIQKGEISIKRLDSIKHELTEISGDSIPNNNLIVINYYHGLDACNSTGNISYVRGLYKNYTRKLKKMNNVSQFFMYESPEGTENYGKKLNWIDDRFDTMKNTFLPLNYPCGSYILIDKDGNYYVQKGEYYILEIIDLLKNKKTFANTVYN